MWKNRNRACFDKKISIPWRLLQNACSYLKLCAGLYKAGLKEKVMGGATINSTMGSYPDDAGSAPTPSVAPYCMLLMRRWIYEDKGGISLGGDMINKVFLWGCGARYV